tara:strand:- start:31702 stop:32322 length:621 start_codon:yes stop_codon:yes gene_type:complete
MLMVAGLQRDFKMYNEKFERFDWIQWLIDDNNYKSFLEIGCFQGQTFNKIKCEIKHSVDPAPWTSATHKVTSDKFFETLDPDYKYDIIFIDGLHTEEQCTKDAENALKHLAPKGIILFHDIDPPNKTSCDTDTCWRSFVKLRTRKDLDSCVYPLREITESVGFLKIRKNSNLLIAKLKSLEWEDLKKNREKWLNFKQEDEIKKWSK